MAALARGMAQRANFTIGFVEEGLHDARSATSMGRLARRDLGPASASTFGSNVGISPHQSGAIAWQARGMAEVVGGSGHSLITSSTRTNPLPRVIWPAILMGHRGLNLPFDVPANQFVTFKGEKASKSEGVGDSVLSYLERFQPDAIRYGLAANLPETSDTDLTEAELVRRNNDELVATWGNLVNRVLAMTHKNFDGAVPQPGPLDARDQALLAHAATMLDEVQTHLEAVHLKAALHSAMSLAQEANGYLSDTEPWKTAKTDPVRTGTSLYVALCAINALKVALYPFLPFSSQKVHEYLGLGGAIEDAGWEVRRPEPGTKLQQPEPLFKKIDAAEIEGEARLSA
jgi:methionyl-tRNA synthetase